MKTLYKDNKFQLNIEVDSVRGVELRINKSRYALTYHGYEPCLYIDSLDDGRHIIVHSAIDLCNIVAAFKAGETTSGWIRNSCYDEITPLRFCELMESEILADRAKSKQQVAEESGLKTASEAKFVCPACSHEWMFDDSNIPRGETYGAVCPKCNTLLKRKKKN